MIASYRSCSVLIRFDVLMCVSAHVWICICSVSILLKNTLTAAQRLLPAA